MWNPRKHHILPFVCILLLLLSAAISLAQGQPTNFRVKETGAYSITVAWRGAPGISSYRIAYNTEPPGTEIFAGTTGGTSFTIKRLRPSTRYVIYLDFNGGTLVLTARTERYPPKPTPTKVRPLAVTCPRLPDSITISGYRTHTQCQQVGPAGVAIDELIAQGIVDAVDIYGQVESIVRVCFRNQGTLKFLDAATAPRAVSDLPVERTEGETCGRIDRAGTVVLMQGIETAGESEEVSLATPSTGPVQINNCQLVTSDYLSLRAGPSVYYQRILSMPRGTRLLATARAGDWFMVEYEEQPGWVSGSFVTTSSDCSNINRSSRVFLQAMAEPAPAATAEPETTTESAEAATATATPGAKPLTDCRLTAGDIINLRQGAGLEYEIIAEIPNLSRLIATERLGEWFKVEYNGEMGWVNIDYVFRNGVCG